MAEINQHFECLIDNLVRLRPSNVGNHADTTGVSFQFWNVQSIFSNVRKIWQLEIWLCFTQMRFKIVPDFGHVSPSTKIKWY